jgi:hypothetical protein
VLAEANLPPAFSAEILLYEQQNRVAACIPPKEVCSGWKTLPNLWIYCNLLPQLMYRAMWLL